MNRYANIAKQMKSRERATKAELIKKNLDNSNFVTRESSSVRRELFAFDKNANLDERDLRFHGTYIFFKYFIYDI